MWFHVIPRLIFYVSSKTPSCKSIFIVKKILFKTEKLRKTLSLNIWFNVIVFSVLNKSFLLPPTCPLSQDKKKEKKKETLEVRMRTAQED